MAEKKKNPSASKYMLNTLCPEMSLKPKKQLSHKTSHEIHKVLNQICVEINTIILCVRIKERRNVRLASIIMKKKKDSLNIYFKIYSKNHPKKNTKF
jgi:acyl-CoA thioesterase FadM